MTLGNKLSKLRKQNNYTQEQLAEILGVSRQAISKWESDGSYPETDKIIQLGKLFDCSLDYLLKDEIEDESGSQKGGASAPGRFYFEKTSKKKIRGVPLWQINIGLGRTARGIIAVGLASKGIVSVGVAAVGILSLGICSVGLVSIGIITAGLLAAGNLAVGLIAMGAISVGLVSLGALAVGEFSAGAMAIGNYLAIGDSARAAVAVGKTEAYGSLYQKVGELSAADYETISELLKKEVPFYYSWAADFVKFFLPVQ